MIYQPDILKEAIRKAEGNGFVLEEAIPSLAPYPGKIETSLTGMIWLSRYAIIYNHSFAKALWGIKPAIFKNDYGAKVSEFPWRHHLTEMVMAQDPIEYLGANI